jgi:hypothetical protein
MAAKLALADIADLRAYERERDDFRRQVIALKRRRRVHVGPVMTLLFENRDTIRFQIQEMARVERLITDDAIQGELDAYNPLVPEPGQLCATVFLELTTDEELREWLPKLVGIERSIALRTAGGDLLRAEPEAAHASQLTREEITASVHYVWWQLDPAQVDAVGAGAATLVVDHPAYRHESVLGGDTMEELLRDLRGSG